MTVTAQYNSIVERAISDKTTHGRAQELATMQLSSGKSGVKASIKPSDQALAAQMDALNKVIDQARLNAKNLSSVIQLATRTLQNMRNTLATMDALAAQAQAGELTDSDKEAIHNVMVELRNGLQTAATETEFNGTKLFTGGAGTVTTAAAVAVAGTNTTSATHANSFAAGANAATQGYVSGEMKNASVTANGTNAFDFKVDIGEQTFIARSVTPTANGVLKLVSESNPNNIFAMTFAADVTDIDTTAELAQAQVAFAEATRTVPGQPSAVVNSVATAANGGFVSATASSTAEAGEYAITYVANSGKLSVQNERGQVFQADVATTGAAQSVKVGNLTVNLDNTFDATAAITQIIVGVEQGGQTAMTSQTGAYSTDITTVNFQGATTDILGLDNLKINAISLLNSTDAAAASNSIKEAMKQISTMYGNLGAAMGNLELKVDVLSDTSAELRNAISGYRDAEIPDAIANEKIAAAAEEMAGIAIGKALQKNQLLLKLAQQAQSTF